MRFRKCVFSDLRRLSGAFNSLYEIRENAFHGSGPRVLLSILFMRFYPRNKRWRKGFHNILSILFMRFRGVPKGHQAPSATNFQFSLWDSFTVSDVREYIKCLSILFMRFRRNVPAASDGYRGLSILFMRFTGSPYA